MDSFAWFYAILIIFLLYFSWLFIWKSHLGANSFVANYFVNLFLKSRKKLYASWRPNRVIIMRHGESEGNKNTQVYSEKPDNQICLTELGIQQAREAGTKLKGIVGNESVLFYVSPYKRSRQTFDEVRKAFDPDQYHSYEDPRLREQDFGNFEDAQEMEMAHKERESFGRFYYRFNISDVCPMTGQFSDSFAPKTS